MTFVETRDLLANHPDFSLFKSIIFKKSDFSVEDLHPEGWFRYQGDFIHTENEYHVRIALRLFWSDEKLQALRKRFDELNSKTQHMNFELEDTCDFDEEEGERTWDARINFKTVLK